jgi:hypothetical protein
MLYGGEAEGASSNAKDGVKAKQFAKAAGCGLIGGCFICSRIERYMGHCVGNTVYLWKTDKAFLCLFERQELFCLPHMNMVAQNAAKDLNRSKFEEFKVSLANIQSKINATLLKNISVFCMSFDYRNARQDIGEAANACEASLDYLCGSCSDHV